MMPKRCDGVIFGLQIRENMKAADEAVITLREIDPLNPMSHFWFGWNHFMNGRFGAAVKEYEICEKVSPGQIFLLFESYDAGL